MKSGLFLALLVTACAQAGPATTAMMQSSEPTIEATTTLEAPTTTEPVTTTSAALDPAPSELEGTWQTVRSDGLNLTLEGTRYQLRSNLGGSSGDISVDGDRITFSNCDCADPSCQDPGTYVWLIEEDSLTLTSADPPDPCSGRRTRLAEVAFTR